MKIYHARLTAKVGLEADGAVEGALAALAGGVD